MKTSLGLKGFCVVSLYDSEGILKEQQKINNLITTSGDLYYATRAAASVVPNGPSQPTLMTGMKLGTGTTLPTKSGSPSGLVLYKTGSNLTFLTGYPTVTAIGTDIGYRVTYYVSWGPGVATDGALAEAVIVNDAATNATTTPANTIARVTFTPINKQAGDTLDISWAHDFLGA